MTYRKLSTPLIIFLSWIGASAAKKIRKHRKTSRSRRRRRRRRRVRAVVVHPSILRLNGGMRWTSPTLQFVNLRPAQASQELEFVGTTTCGLKNTKTKIIGTSS